ncbi:hypothetical protein SYJ56_23100 [Algoriphagus sp. D3-2-R+10]|nr:hypothetical protein [Algoriphagus sp. D3-2-R+10]MEB2778217.1 hypothetical protein [Algoriphagus sp. D3-2-R+10]
MKSRITITSHEGMIINYARISRIDPDNYRDGTGYLTLKNQL